MTSSHPLPAVCQWFARLASALDRRAAPRLALLFLGAVLARGRRTVTSWIRAAKLGDEFQSCYTAVAAAGKEIDSIAAYLVLTVVTPLLGGGERLTLARDDTPTERYGPHVQGAGVHHNPTPGRLAVRLRPRLRRPRAPGHPPGVRRDRSAPDSPVVHPQKGPAGHRPEAPAGIPDQAGNGRRTAAVGQEVAGAAQETDLGGGRGAYAKANFLKPAKGLGMSVVIRLRKDAALWTVPGPKPPGRRGPAPTYGDRRVELAKRGGQRRGWSTGEFDLYGEVTDKLCKTFVATWRPAGGAIRVVLVDDPTG